MERNVLIKIEYDGKNFNGWQRQEGFRTVQGTLEEALSIYTGVPITINGTSRTDKGVHALGQMASFKGDFNIPLNNLKFAVNNFLQGGMNVIQPIGDCRILEISEVPLNFHARYDSKGKTYRYVIYNGDNCPVFRKDYCFYVKDKLDTTKMIEGTKYIIGTHDFLSFQGSTTDIKESTIRTIKDIEIKKENDDIIIEITGDGFLYNMVRIIVGTLVNVGLGKTKPRDIKGIIEGKNRSLAGFTAPASGLYLKEIYF